MSDKVRFMIEPTVVWQTFLMIDGEWRLVDQNKNLEHSIKVVRYQNRKDDITIEVDGVCIDEVETGA